MRQAMRPARKKVKNARCRVNRVQQSVRTRLTRHLSRGYPQHLPAYSAGSSHSPAVLLGIFSRFTRQVSEKRPQPEPRLTRHLSPLTTRFTRQNSRFTRHVGATYPQKKPDLLGMLLGKLPSWPPSAGSPLLLLINHSFLFLNNIQKDQQSTSRQLHPAFPLACSL